MILVILLLLLGIVIRMELEQQRGWLLLDFGKNKITGKQVETFWQEADEETKQFLKDITIYQNPEKKVVQSELGKKKNVLVYRVYGTMEHVQGDKLVYGGFVQSEDKTGCMIGKKLAQELFHTENAVGEEIKIKNQSWYVRGVLETGKNVCMIPGEEEQSYRYLWVHDKEMAALEVKEKIQNAMYYNAKIKWEGDFYAILGDIICTILWSGIWIFLLIKGKKIYNTRIKNPIQKDAADILWIICLVAGLFLIIALGIKPTDDYLPNEWSDFSFWSHLLVRKSTEFVEQVFR